MGGKRHFAPVSDSPPSPAVTPLRAPSVSLLEGAALFLDFDGTLAPIADTPCGVEVDEELIGTLLRLRDALDGRLAIVSGRSVATLRDFGFTDFLIAGTHGLEFAAPGADVDAPARLPAMTALMLRLLTAQLPPPIPGPADAPADTDSGADTGAGPAAVESGQLLLARADRLLDMGALDRAQALLMATGAGDPQIFRRLFDIALLEGDESRACDIMNTTPGIAPSFAARIFCLAQTGDWAAAAISLSGAERLRLISADQALLMQHFLDDTFVDSGEVLEPSQPMTPLNFRIFEAIGQPLPSLGLPIAFAQSDLRANNGWKTRLEAAERLARIGAIDPGRLRAIYAEQKPPASGGVWERAGAMRTLEAALAQGDPAAALPAAFDQFRAAGMADVLAAMVADELPPNLEGRAGEVASWLRQWQGLPAATPLPTDPVLLSGQTPPPAQRRGEALLAAMADIDAGLDGDLARAGRGLAVLRGLGLEADADLAAAQLSLLPVMTKAPQ